VREHVQVDKERKRKPRPEFFEQSVDLGSMKVAIWVLVVVEIVKGAIPYVIQ